MAAGHWATGLLLLFFKKKKIVLFLKKTKQKQFYFQAPAAYWSVMGLTLVTGAAGFIGSNVARALCAAGRVVVGCDRMRSGPKWRNIVDVPLHDIVTPEALPAWWERHAGAVDLVVHLGAVTATTETDVDRILRDNLRCTLDLWQWCASARVPFIYASSAATYGDGAAGFLDDDSPDYLATLRPMNAYGWSKHLIDRRLVADARDGRKTPPFWAGLKFFNVYGPGENHKGDMRSLVNKLMPVVKSGAAVRLFRSYRADYADGEQVRDFVFVDDVVGVITWLIAARPASGLYNVGSGAARSWNDLAKALFHSLGQAPRIEYMEMPPEIRPQYQYRTLADIGKLRGAGWTSGTTSLEDGIRAYVERAG
jgi:ADP-L-glycero-D-manno-heptose 6-epimerase